MSEEGFETGEMKESLDQHVEHAEHEREHGHGKHGGEETEAEIKSSWTKWLSLSTAMIAVFAALASLMSGSSSDEAILEKSDAMLASSQASDVWGEYQATRIKLAITQNQIDTLTAIQQNGADATAITTLQTKKDEYEKKSKERSEAAKEIENQRDEHSKESDHLSKKHDKFALTVTLLQVSIALAAIAALTRRKELWFGGLAVGAAGVGMFVLGMLA